MNKSDDDDDGDDDDDDIEGLKQRNVENVFKSLNIYERSEELTVARLSSCVSRLFISGSDVATAVSCHVVP